MRPEGEGLDLRRTGVEAFGHEVLEAGGVEHAGLADDPPRAARATSAHNAVISSSGLETTMMTASGEPATSLLVTSPTILALTSSRSIRLMPGLRGRPAVMTQTSEPAVSS